jgi:hypothetical protein
LRGFAGEVTLGVADHTVRRPSCRADRVRVQHSRCADLSPGIETSLANRSGRATAVWARDRCLGARDRTTQPAWVPHGPACREMPASVYERNASLRLAVWSTNPSGSVEQQDPGRSLQDHRDIEPPHRRLIMSAPQFKRLVVCTYGRGTGRLSGSGLTLPPGHPAVAIVKGGRLGIADPIVIVVPN